MRQPILCHEFLGKINDHRYRIFMSGETGLEENIEEIPDSEKAIY
jgi:spore germination protein